MSLGDRFLCVLWSWKPTGRHLEKKIDEWEVGRAGACWELLTMFMPFPFVSDLAPVWPAKTELFAAQVDVLAADVMVQMECWWYCTAFSGCKDAFLPTKRVPTDQRKEFCEPEFIWVSLQELGSLLQLHH